MVSEFLLHFYIVLFAAAMLKIFTILSVFTLALFFWRNIHNSVMQITCIDCYRDLAGWIVVDSTQAKATPRKRMHGIPSDLTQHLRGTLIEPSNPNLGIGQCAEAVRASDSFLSFLVKYIPFRTLYCNFDLYHTILLE